MDTLIEKFVPFPVIDMTEKKFGETGVALFGKMLQLNLKNCGIDIVENPECEIFPQKGKPGKFTLSITVEGKNHQKKLDITISEIGTIWFEILFHNITGGKWESVEDSEGFLVIDEFNDKFCGIINTLE